MTALADWLAGAREQLTALNEAGLRRSLRDGAGIDLVSNDYLGLAGHPHLRAAMRAALYEHGAGAGGSRLLCATQAPFTGLEERLAAFSGAEAALLFGSGYAANVGLLQTLLGPDDVVLSDALNHASLIDGIRLGRARRVIYPHADVGAVEDALRAPHRGGAFIVTESVFSMEGDLAPLAALADAASRHGALLVIDEAHATGLYGERGAGRVQELGLRERVLATIHTGGKALGSAGAWVAGPAVLRDLLVNRARTFIFATAPLPVLTAALGAALDVLDREPERRLEVHRKGTLLRSGLLEHGADARGEGAIVPVIAGANDAAVRLQEGLRAAGFDARAVRPPTVPDGTARLRVTARAPVADVDLVRFAREVGRLLGARAA